MTDGEIRGIFNNADDFMARELSCCGQRLYVYAIDGLVSSGDL